MSQPIREKLVEEWIYFNAAPNDEYLEKSVTILFAMLENFKRIYFKENPEEMLSGSPLKTTYGWQKDSKEENKMWVYIKFYVIPK